MFRNYAIFCSFVAVVLSACGTPASTVEITPSNCALNPGDQMTFSIKGVIGSNSTIRWNTTDGIIQAQEKDGLVATFTAPQTPETVTISADISNSLTPTGSVSTNCVISGQGPATNPINPVNSTSSNGSTQAAAPSHTASLANAYPIAISEVMGNPCGNDDFKKWNEYVELYNYGTVPIDVGGWWLVDSGPNNRAEQLIAWDQRLSGVSLNQDVVTNSTVLLPKHFAVILSPIYTQGIRPYAMPYQFPKGTEILTIAEGDRLGDPTLGIVGYGPGRDVVVLYIGGSNSIQTIVSTYGSPVVGPYPQDIHDNLTDNIPLDLHECSSAERVDPAGPDVFNNWKEVKNGSPGQAPYH